MPIPAACCRRARHHATPCRATAEQISVDATPRRGAATICPSRATGPNSTAPQPNRDNPRLANASGSTVQPKPHGDANDNPATVRRKRGSGAWCPSISMSDRPSAKRPKPPIMPRATHRPTRSGSAKITGRDTVRYNQSGMSSPQFSHALTLSCERSDACAGQGRPRGQRPFGPGSRGWNPPGRAPGRRAERGSLRGRRSAGCDTINRCRP